MSNMKYSEKLHFGKKNYTQREAEVNNNNDRLNPSILRH